MLLKKFSLVIQTSILCSSFILAPNLFATEKSIAELVDAVNGTFDKQSREAGKKVKLRNHAKGFCTSGAFVPAPSITSKLAVPFFSEAEMSLTARFSLAGTNPNASDKGAGRFMSLNINGESEHLHFVTSNARLFFASNLADFYTFQTKVKQGAAGKQWLIDHKPEAKAFFEYVSTLKPSKSFANSQYFGVNTFLFNTKNSDQVAGRWIFEPVDGERFLTEEALSNLSDDFLQNELLTRIKSKPVTWNVYLKLANSNDPVNNPAVLWPEDRKQLLVGQVIIDGRNDSEAATQTCDSGIFNPVILPQGIAPSADPILNARPRAYVESLIRRL